MNVGVTVGEFAPVAVLVATTAGVFVWAGGGVEIYVEVRPAKFIEKTTTSSSRTTRSRETLATTTFLLRRCGVGGNGSTGCVTGGASEDKGSISGGVIFGPDVSGVCLLASDVTEEGGIKASGVDEGGRRKVGAELGQLS